MGSTKVFARLALRRESRLCCRVRLPGLSPLLGKCDGLRLAWPVPSQIACRPLPALIFHTSPMRSLLPVALLPLKRGCATTLLALAGLAASAGLAHAQISNVALNRPVTAETDTVSGSPPEAVDGDYSTVWYSYQGTDSTISFVVDLQGIVTVQGYRLQPSQTQDYVIYTSLDGVTWTARYDENDWLPWPDMRLRNLSVAAPYYQARYVRYVGRNVGQTAFVGVADFEVLADDAQTAFTVTASAGSGGSAACTPDPVVRGGSAVCVATPGTGFRFVSWDGACAGQAATCVLNGVTSFQSAAATFAPLETRVQAVPTLSQWASAGLGLLLATLGLRRLRRR